MSVGYLIGSHVAYNHTCLPVLFNSMHDIDSNRIVVVTNGSSVEHDFVQMGTRMIFRKPEASSHFIPVVEMDLGASMGITHWFYLNCTSRCGPRFKELVEGGFNPDADCTLAGAILPLGSRGNDGRAMNDLAKVMEAEENIQGVCHPTLEVMYALKPHTLDEIPVPDWRNYLTALNIVPRRTILFTVTVAQAEASCNIFNRIVPGISEWICGKTSKRDRHDIFERFKSGKTHLLCNVGVTVEGFDLPAVEVIAMGRPTLSLSTYVQMVGRGTRTLPGVIEGKLAVSERLEAIKASVKPIVRIVDFKGNSKRHKLITSFHALGYAIRECGGFLEEKEKHAMRQGGNL